MMATTVAKRPGRGSKLRGNIRAPVPYVVGCANVIHPDGVAQLFTRLIEAKSNGD
jgi:hypothetical protein